MTRRDRYALALALECLRNYTHPLDARDAIQDAHTALGLPTLSDGGPSVALDLALSAALRESWADEDGRSARLLRARLALLLRVLLRVDRGDYGKPQRVPAKTCRRVNHNRCGFDRTRCWNRECGCWADGPRSFTPLWDLAAGASR